MWTSVSGARLRRLLIAGFGQQVSFAATDVFGRADEWCYLIGTSTRRSTDLYRLIVLLCTSATHHPVSDQVICKSERKQRTSGIWTTSDVVCRAFSRYPGRTSLKFYNAPQPGRAMRASLGGTASCRKPCPTSFGKTRTRCYSDLPFQLEKSVERIRSSTSFLRSGSRREIPGAGRGLPRGHESNRQCDVR